jgi:hypothetical protein
VTKQQRDSATAPSSPAYQSAVRLRGGDGAAQRGLLEIVDAEVGRRGLRATHGGSFGFRGHRYELIEPDHEDGVAFLRVALGFREGRTLDGLIALFRELASRPRLER